MEVNIRPAHSGDVAALRALAAQSPGAALWTADQYLRLFAPDSPRRCILVIEDAGAPDGCIAGFIVGLRVAHEWEIENIAICPESQGRGLGSHLLAAFITEARRQSAATIHLEVRASNSAALGLYTKAGFQQTGCRPGYYSAPLEDAILLSLPIS